MSRDRKHVLAIIALAVTVLTALIGVALWAGSLRAQLTDHGAEIIELRKDDQAARVERADNHESISVSQAELRDILRQLKAVADRLDKNVPSW